MMGSTFLLRTDRINVVIFVTVCCLFEQKQICTVLLSFDYICIVVGDPIIRRGIQLTGLTSSLFWACPKVGTEFPTLYNLLIKIRSQHVLPIFYRCFVVTVCYKQSLCATKDQQKIGSKCRDIILIRLQHHMSWSFFLCSMV